MNYSSSLNQIYVYVLLSLFISFFVNTLRTESLPYIAIPIEKVEDISQIEDGGLQPQIREISIDIAEKLFSDNILLLIIK